MFFFTFTAAILATVCVFTGTFLLLRKGSDLLARMLAYYILAIGVWVGSNAMADVAANPAPLIFWSGMALIGAAFFVSFFLCFVYVFVRGRRPGPGRLLVYFLPTAVFTTGAFSRLSVVEPLFPAGIPAQIVPGVFYTWILVFILGSLVYGSVELIMFYRGVAKPQQKMQVIYMLAGFALLCFSTVCFGIILPLFGEYRLYSAGPQSSIFVIVLSGYAILKHRMLDIRVVVQRGVVYSALFILIAIFYLTVLQLIGLTIGASGQAPFLFASILTTVVGLWGLRPIERLFRRATDPLFFKDRYVLSEAVDIMSQTASEYLDLQTLLAEIARVLNDIFRTSSAVIRLVQPAEAPGTSPASGLLIPVISDAGTIAEIVLGPKRSGDPWFEDDTRLLGAFARQCATAIERAKLFKSVKEYSERLEEKVRERTEEVRRLNETQAAMMIDISHSLQTPLTILRGRLDAFHAKSGDDVDDLRLAIEKLSEYVHRMLRLARLQKTESIERVPLDLSVIVEDIVSYFSVVAEQQEIRLETSIKPGVSILGDKTQIEELILNLLSNAAKYIAGERIVSVRLTAEGTAVRLTVQDTGVGIPAEVLKNLFHRFRRGPDSRTRGSGLGLAIAKRIVDLHGANLEIESEEGRGTTVSLTLPSA